MSRAEIAHREATAIRQTMDNTVPVPAPSKPPLPRVQRKLPNGRFVDLEEDVQKPLEMAPSPPASTTRRFRRELETHWYQCFAYSARVLPPTFGLALGETVFTAAFLFFLPQAVEMREESPWVLPLLCLLLLVPVGVLGYAFALLDGALKTALAGNGQYVYWPGRSIAPALQSGLRWLACFLAGPVLPAGAAFVYWLRCGDPDAIDYWILADLGIFAVGYWLFILAAVARSDRIVDVNPLSVARLVHRLRWRAAVATILGSVLLFGHGFCGAWAGMELHRNPALGGLLLLGCWTSALFFGTFLFRLVGVWCYHAQCVEESPG